jgi:hypothetical protein
VQSCMVMDVLLKLYEMSHGCVSIACKDVLIFFGRIRRPPVAEKLFKMKLLRVPRFGHALHPCYQKVQQHSMEHKQARGCLARATKSEGVPACLGALQQAAIFECETTSGACSKVHTLSKLHDTGCFWQLETRILRKYSQKVRVRGLATATCNRMLTMWPLLPASGYVIWNVGAVGSRRVIC